MATEKVRLVFSDLAKNSYKYYDIELTDSGGVSCSYGVVGAKNPQTNDYGNVGRSFFEKKIKENERKGYSRAKVLMEGTVSTPVNKGSDNLRCGRRGCTGAGGTPTLQSSIPTCRPRVE